MIQHVRASIVAVWLLWRLRHLDLPSRRRLIAFRYAVLKVQAVALVTETQAAELVSQYGLGAWRRLLGLE